MIVSIRTVWIVCSGFLIFSGSASAQLSIGVKTGISRSLVRTDISNLSFTNLEHGTGYNVEVDLTGHLKGKIFFQAGIDVCEKDYSLVRTGEFKGAYQSSINTYVQVPVSLQWRTVFRKFSVFCNAGIYGARWISARVKGVLPNVLDMSTTAGSGGLPATYFNPVSYNERYRFSSVRDNRFEYGWLTGGGIGYMPRPKLFFFAAVDYFGALSDMQKKYMINQTARYNETYFFSLGCQLAYHRHGHRNNGGL